MKLRTKLILGGFFVTLAFGGAAYALWWRLFPISASEISQKIELWRAGTRRVEVKGLSGFERNHCPGAACVCVGLIHGLGDSSLTWRKVLLAPSDQFTQPVRLVALDLPGNGMTPRPADASDYRVRRLAERLRDSLGSQCSRWVLVGNSLGGWVATWMGLEWTGGVSRLLLLGPAGFPDSELSPGKVLPLLTVESLKQFQARAYFHPRKHPDYVWSDAAARFNRGNFRQVAAAQTADDFLSETVVRRLQIPTLILWGEADRVALSVKEFEKIPSVMLKKLPECGHLPQKECPQAVIEGINSMLTFGSI